MNKAFKPLANNFSKTIFCSLYCEADNRLLLNKADACRKQPALVSP